MFGVFAKLANDVADQCLQVILDNHTDRSDIFLNVNYNIQSFHPNLRVEIIYTFNIIVTVAINRPGLFDAELTSPENLAKYIAFEYFNAKGSDGFEMTRFGLVERKGKRVQVTDNMVVS